MRNETHCKYCETTGTVQMMDTTTTLEYWLCDGHADLMSATGRMVEVGTEEETTFWQEVYASQDWD